MSAGRWRPSPLIRASFWLHGLALVAAVALLIVRPAAGLTGLALIALILIANHVVLTGTGLWPRSRWLGPNLVDFHQQAAAAGAIVLTIDDGPDPAVTPAVLDLLARHDARATFFLIGHRARRHPDLVRRIVAEGHGVENHSDSHDHGFSLRGSGWLARDIGAAQRTLAELTGRTPRFFRAPAGLRSPLLEPVLARAGLRLAAWTRRGFDTRAADPTCVLARLAGRHGERLADGDILLLHDGHAARDDTGRPVVLPVLEQLLPLCRQRGFTVRSLDDILPRGGQAEVAATGAPGPTPLPPALLDAATAPYRQAGRFAYHFARGKLGGDPAFGIILASDWIRPGMRVLDLGCGQGLLASLLDEAGRDCEVHGIELMPADVRRAEQALASTIARGRASFACDDIRHADFGRAQVAVILDVLHYIDLADQQAVLERLRDALAPDGLLLLRIGDADGGLPFRISNWVDRTVTFVRGHRLGTLYCRPLSGWVASLVALGFTVRPVPASQGTPFANVLLEARLAGPADPYVAPGGLGHPDRHC